MWIELGRTGDKFEAPTWSNTLASLASGLAICATFLIALALAGSP